MAKARPRGDDDDEEDRPRKKKKSKGGGVNTVIPYRNIAALGAYYCAVFGLIPAIGGILVPAMQGANPSPIILKYLPFLGFLFAPVAMALGGLGVFIARKSEQAQGMFHAIVGIVLGFLELVVCIGAVIYIFVIAKG